MEESVSDCNVLFSSTLCYSGSVLYPPIQEEMVIRRNIVLYHTAIYANVYNVLHITSVHCFLLGREVSQKIDRFAAAGKLARWKSIGPVYFKMYYICWNVYHAARYIGPVVYSSLTKCVIWCVLYVAVYSIYRTLWACFFPTVTCTHCPMDTPSATQTKRIKMKGVNPWFVRKPFLSPWKHLRPSWKSNDFDFNSTMSN